jgi:hypothetical protein
MLKGRFSAFCHSKRPHAVPVITVWAVGRAKSPGEAGICTYRAAPLASRHCCCLLSIASSTKTCCSARSGCLPRTPVACFCLCQGTAVAVARTADCMPVRELHWQPEAVQAHSRPEMHEPSSRFVFVDKPCIASRGSECSRLRFEIPRGSSCFWEEIAIPRLGALTLVAGATTAGNSLLFFLPNARPRASVERAPRDLAPVATQGCFGALLGPRTGCCFFPLHHGASAGLRLLRPRQPACNTRMGL